MGSNSVPRKVVVVTVVDELLLLVLHTEFQIQFIVNTSRLIAAIGFCRKLQQFLPIIIEMHIHDGFMSRSGSKTQKRRCL